MGIFCELARNPAHAQKIYEEVKDLDVRDAKALSKSLHLEAVIAEGLRLYPALPTGGYRKTKESGITVGGIYIPPYTTVVAPRYIISRRACSIRFGFIILELTRSRGGLFQTRQQVYSRAVV